MKAIKETNLRNKVRTVSLFSGAGGLDIGAIKAGAHIVWANDLMKEACMSYRANIGDHIRQGDINTFVEELSELKNIDLVIGGPPCQGFSVAGKMDANDKRSKLIWSYTKVVSILQPKCFVMENVKALATLEKWSPIKNKLLKTFRDLGYAVNYIVVNASDYDVPQSRERIFVVGFKGDSSKTPDLDEMLKPFRKKARTVREALSVLDKAGEGNNKGVCNAKITLCINPVMRKSPYAGMLFNGLGRPTRLDGYCATLPASMGGNKTPIIDEHELYEGAEPWVVSYHKRLQENPTIAKYAPAPNFLRRMTVEEAALLQTFPMEYEFQGSQSSKYTQIGNAVPCNLAKAVVSMVINEMTGKLGIKYVKQIKELSIFD